MDKQPQKGQDPNGLREPSKITRRQFFSWLGWGSSALIGGGLSLGALAYISPSLTLEPALAYAVGRPEDYNVGEMRLIESRRVFVFRTPDGFQTVSAVCTHLGCTYQPFVEADSTYNEVHAHCPCHGSVFQRDGAVLKGPAPRPLPFYAMYLTPDGRLFVDESINDDTSWAGIDHTLYLTESGEQIKGPLPDGQQIDFG